MMWKPLLPPGDRRILPFFIRILVAACAANPGAPDDDIKKYLLGKSQAEILACAGPPRSGELD